jgi:signal transduction histidine kinase
VRNPLSSIGLNVEMLEEETSGSGPEVQALLRAIHREVDRLTAVTEEYLRLARLPEPRLEQGDVGETVREVGQFVRAEMANAGVVFVVDVPGALPVVAFDEGQLRQALLNLLRNAREAMLAPGGHVRVSVDVESAQVIVRVADDGPGIAPEVQARIFDPFFTTKERGTGLGLPLTQQIVAAHGGRIGVKGAPGQGTTFELAFPIAGDTLPRDALQRSGQAPEATGAAPEASDP